MEWLIPLVSWAIIKVGRYGYDFIKKGYGKSLRRVLLARRGSHGVLDFTRMAWHLGFGFLGGGDGILAGVVMILAFVAFMVLDGEGEMVFFDVWSLGTLVIARDEGSLESFGFRFLNFLS